MHQDREDRAQLEAWDAAHLWHPFTPHAVYPDEAPLIVARGDGNYVFDVDGRRYLDGVASLWCNVLGHRVPAIDRAVREQLERIAHATLLGNASVPAIRLAKKLTELAPPSLEKVFFSDNGSTAVEVALKMAYQYWRQVGGENQRTKFLALEHAYHGDTLGAVSVGGIALFHATFEDLVFDVVRAPFWGSEKRSGATGSDEHARRAIAALESTFREHHHHLAAAIVEPGFLGAGGILTYPKGYLRRLEELCRAHDVLLIFDEVAAGMGRSGALFACQREDVTPDFLCIAKGLTGGYMPLAATLTTKRIFDAFVGPPADGKTFFHGHTFTGNALGCAAALATLDCFEHQHVLDRLPDSIARLAAALLRLENTPGVLEIRQYGLAVGIELARDCRLGTPYPAAERRGMRVCRRAREKGVFLRPLGDVIVLMPPLTVTDDEIELLVSAVEHGIREELSDAT